MPRAGGKFSFFRFLTSHSWQPKSDRKWSSFTNCILTCVWGDGKNWTPCTCFTYNPAFRGEEAEKLFREFDIDPRRVTILKRPPKKKSSYARESLQQVTDFFELYTIDENHHILSDGGASFKKGGESIFEDLPFQKHDVYPSPVHQFLSPNDNKLHGVAKGKWRKRVTDWRDDVRNTLILMQELDRVKAANIRKWFDANLQLRQDAASEEAAELCIFGKGSKSEKRFSFFEQCEQEYLDFAKVQLRRNSGGAVGVPRALNSGFDGRYWTKYE